MKKLAVTAKYITRDPKILGGKPVIRGTRISVELIINFLAAGMSVDDILGEYKELKRAEILAAISFAAKVISRASGAFPTANL